MDSTLPANGKMLVAALSLMAALAPACSAASALEPILRRAPIWSDEFDHGAGDGQWDRGLSPWQRSIANRILPSGERQVYVDGPYLSRDTLKQGRGTIILTAERMDSATRKLVDHRIGTEQVPPRLAEALKRADWVSAVLKGRRSFRYGYIEASMRWDGNKSAWPAFWLLPAKWGWPPEIDILEIPGDGIAHQTLHTGPGDPSPRPTCKTPLVAPDKFHSYGVLWTAEKITFFVDRKPTCSFPTPADMHQPMYPIVNLAVGGWAKPPDSSTPATLSLEVDYVRWWAL